MSIEGRHDEHGPLAIDGTDSGDVGFRMTLSGEFDMEGAPRFRAAVTEALGRGRRHIAVDTGALSFIDSSALLALLSAQAEVEAVGGAFGLTKVSDPVSRILDMTALADDLLDLPDGE